MCVPCNVIRKLIKWIYNNKQNSKCSGVIFTDDCSASSLEGRKTGFCWGLQGHYTEMSIKYPTNEK